MGRGTVGEGGEDVVKHVGLLFLRHAEGVEHGLLEVGLMDPDRAAAEFVAVENHVVGLGADVGVVAGLELVLPSRPYGVRLAVDLISKKTGVPIEPTYDVDSYWVIKSLVKSGVCHSFMPLSSVTADLEAGLLEVRKTAPSPATRQLILGMPSDRSNTRATDAVIEILKDEIAVMIRKGEWAATPDTDLHELLSGAA